MPVATGGFSYFGAFKSILGKVPRLFTYMFVAFIFLSTVSDGFNKMQETGKISDFAVSVGVAIVKPLVQADRLIGDAVGKFSAPLSRLQTIEAWLSIYGGITVIYFIYKWTAEYGVKALVPEGMNSSFSIFLITAMFLIMLTTMYYSIPNGSLTFGGGGIYALFTHFSDVFRPIISVGENLLRLQNKLPDANVPVFR